jgi:tryptophanyl-tRNA synthetase
VGKDQIQHIEISRDVAARFNNQQGETFVLPKAQIQEESQIIPGTDGQKMSKSKNNTINIFLPEKKLRKQIMGIQTDSTPLEKPKKPETCTVYKLYSLLANEDQILSLRNQYVTGGMGYGDAKQALFELILEIFDEPRKKFNYFQNNPSEVTIALAKGAQKAHKVATNVLMRVRSNIGY